MNVKTYPMQIVELFAGAAGLAQGFVNSGHYGVGALYDIFEPAQTSYLRFDPATKYKVRDVQELTGTEILDDLDGKSLDGIIGGPPCQGFSLAGKRLTHSDINKLVLAYARVVQALEPPFLVMENVPQLMYHPLFRPLRDMLEPTYRVSYAILNAARYGAPQTRHRLFVLAYHRDLGITPTFPAPTHGKLGQLLYAYHLQDSSDRIHLTNDTYEAILGADLVVRREIRLQADNVTDTLSNDLEPLVTVGDAISDIALDGEPGTRFSEYVTGPATEYQKRLRNPDSQVANCVARKHVGRPLEIAKSLREGGTPESDGGPRNKRYYSQAYGRLHRRGLARTLTTYFQNAGSGRFLHYEQPRTLTIREAARLQGFPDRFEFFGTLGDQMQLVGNAVPLPLAEAIGRHVFRELAELIPGTYRS
jgi:DNA (cytosine-5)-methyltransferase 1